MQHVTAVERSWLQKHIDKVRKLDSPSLVLCGRTPIKSPDRKRKFHHEDVGKSSSSAVMTVLPPQQQSTGTLDKGAAISAARERFLKRKAKK